MEQRFSHISLPCKFQWVKNWCIEKEKETYVDEIYLENGSNKIIEVKPIR
jgi:hypothetical protein